MTKLFLDSTSFWIKFWAFAAINIVFISENLKPTVRIYVENYVPS